MKEPINNPSWNLYLDEVCSFAYWQKSFLLKKNVKKNKIN